MLDPGPTPRWRSRRKVRARELVAKGGGASVGCSGPFFCCCCFWPSLWSPMPASLSNQRSHQPIFDSGVVFFRPEMSGPVSPILIEPVAGPPAFSLDDVHLRVLNLLLAGWRWLRCRGARVPLKILLCALLRRWMMAAGGPRRTPCPAPSPSFLGPHSHPHLAQPGWNHRFWQVKQLISAGVEEAKKEWDSTADDLRHRITELTSALGDVEAENIVLKTELGAGFWKGGGEGNGCRVVGTSSALTLR